MPMIPTQPNAATAATADPAVAADAPEGAFEEMLARRLGRQLVGRFAREHGEGAESGLDGEPLPWMPPSATPNGADAPPVGTSSVEVATTTPTIRPLRTEPIVGAPQPTPVRISVNRPGFPEPMAEPGDIQPGPNGDVWTHPSGFADLQLSRGQTAVEVKAMPTASLQLGTAQAAADRAAAPVVAPASPETVEPPVVHWSPAPARAALAAAANRDLELEIVTKMAQQVQQSKTAEPRLRVVETATAEPTAPIPPSVSFDPGAATVDTAGIGSTPAAGTAPANVPHTALVERVMTAVEMQQHLPPPRAIAIEIPEVEGLRLLVTMRMDGSIHVASSGTTAQVTNEQVTPLLQAVNEALTERGFDMSADTGGRQSTEQDANDEPVPPRTPRFRRAARRSGLRI